MHSSSYYDNLLVIFELKWPVPIVKQVRVKLIFFDIEFVLIRCYRQQMDRSSLARLYHDFVFVVDIFQRLNFFLGVSEHFLAFLVRKGVGIGEKGLHAFRKGEIEVQFSIILFSLPPYNLLILQKQLLATLFPTIRQ
jgi:hypothetical protein